MLPIVVPLLTLGAAGYLARNRNTTRSAEAAAASSAHEPSPLTVLGAFLSLGETPPLAVVVSAIAHAESSGYTDLSEELVRLFLVPAELEAPDRHEVDASARHATASHMGRPVPRMGAAVATGARRNSAAAVAAAMAATRSTTPPAASWSRANPAVDGSAPVPTRSTTNSPASAVAPTHSASSGPVTVDAVGASPAVDTAAVPTPASSGPAAATVAETIDAEAQRVLEMLVDPARRAGKVELLSGSAARRGSDVEVEAQRVLDELTDPKRHAAHVELLSAPAGAATVEVPRRTAAAHEPMVDADAQRVLEMLADPASCAAKVELLPAAAEVDADAQRVLEKLSNPGLQTAKVELLSGPRAPEVMLASRSPIDGVAPAAWLMFVGRVSRESPSFCAAQHVGRFRQRRDRLRELGIDPAKIVDSPEAQLAALDADMRDAYQHACASGLVDEYLGTELELSVVADARAAEVTLSGVLGVIQAAGLEGAVEWLQRPADRTRFPNTTQAFLRCNGVF